MTKCYLCGYGSFLVKNKRTRDKKNIRVLQCKNCSLTMLSAFKHIHKDVYRDSFYNYEKVINKKQEYRQLLTDLFKDDSRRFLRLKKIISGKDILDFGCGAGGFLKMAKTVTKSVEGVEIDQITRFYSDQIKVVSSLESLKRKFDVITLFHVLEHLPDPINLLKKLKKYLKIDGCIIIEVPNDDDVLVSYYKLPTFKNFTYWSPHLFSFNKKTLSSVALHSGFQSIDVEYVQRYPLANHIGWIKNGKPGGHLIFNKLCNTRLEKAYADQLASFDACDTLFVVLEIN